MLTKEKAARVRQAAVGILRSELLNTAMQPEKDVVLPEKAPKNPKKWVVMETTTIAPNGSPVRYTKGQVIDSKSEMNILKNCDVDVRPYA